MSDSLSSAVSDTGSKSSDGQRSDSGGSRSDHATNQQAADHLDGRESGTSGGAGGLASGQDAANRLDQVGKGGEYVSDFIAAPTTGTSDALGGGGATPSGAVGDYRGISEPYSNLPKGGPGERTSELRPPPPGPPGGNDDSRKSKVRQDFEQSTKSGRN